MVAILPGVESEGLESGPQCLGRGRQPARGIPFSSQGPVVTRRLRSGCPLWVFEWLSPSSVQRGSLPRPSASRMAPPWGGLHPLASHFLQGPCHPWAQRTAAASGPEQNAGLCSLSEGTSSVPCRVVAALSRRTGGEERKQSELATWNWHCSCFFSFIMRRSVNPHRIKMGTWAPSAVQLQKDVYDLEAFFLFVSLRLCLF